MSFIKWKNLFLLSIIAIINVQLKVVNNEYTIKKSLCKYKNYKNHKPLVWNYNGKQKRQNA